MTLVDLTRQAYSIDKYTALGQGSPTLVEAGASPCSGCSNWHHRPAATSPGIEFPGYRSFGRFATPDRAGYEYVSVYDLVFGASRRLAARGGRGCRCERARCIARRSISRRKRLKLKACVGRSAPIGGVASREGGIRARDGQLPRRRDAFGSESTICHWRDRRFGQSGGAGRRHYPHSLRYELSALVWRPAGEVLANRQRWIRRIAPDLGASAGGSAISSGDEVLPRATPPFRAKPGCLERQKPGSGQSCGAGRGK